MPRWREADPSVSRRHRVSTTCVISQVVNSRRVCLRSVNPGPFHQSDWCTSKDRQFLGRLSHNLGDFYSLLTTSRISTPRVHHQCWRLALATAPYSCLAALGSWTLLSEHSARSRLLASCVTSGHTARGRLQTCTACYGHAARGRSQTCQWVCGHSARGRSLTC